MGKLLQYSWASLVAQLAKNLPAMCPSSKLFSNLQLRATLPAAKASKSLLCVMGKAVPHRKKDKHTGSIFM